MRMMDLPAKPGVLVTMSACNPCMHAQGRGPKTVKPDRLPTEVEDEAMAPSKDG